MKNIIGHRKIFLTISGILFLASFIMLAMWGLKLGIDFTGGSLLEVEFANSIPPQVEIQTTLQPLSLGNVLIQPTGEKGVMIRFQNVDENKHQQILAALSYLSHEGGYGQMTEKRFDAIGPTIGKELFNKSILAIILTLSAIIIYITWAFRQVSKPVSSWKYGVAAVIALFHDVVLPMGVFSALGHYRGIEIDTLFITAILTILGFSVHDTIVVFDRIRENLRKLKHSENFEETVNRSVNETIARSINTSFTVLLVLLSVFLLGGETVKYFSLALILGVVFGTYSSIFIASPILVIWNKMSAKRGN